MAFPLPGFGLGNNDDNGEQSPWWNPSGWGQSIGNALGQSREAGYPETPVAGPSAQDTRPPQSFWPNRPETPGPSIPEPGPSAATSAPAAAPPNALDPTTQGMLDAQTQNILNESKQKAAEAQLAEARVKELEANIARRDDPNSIESQTAATQLEAAKAALAKSQFEMQQAQNSLTPEQQIRLQDSLARSRSQIEAQVRATQSALDHEFTARENAANRDFQSGLQDRQDARSDKEAELQVQLWQGQKQLRLYELMLGQEDKAADRAMRQSELDYQRGIDSQRLGLDNQRLDLDKQRAAQDFQLRMMAQKVAEGELSARKAFNKFQEWIEKQRLPSEVARNKSAAYAPFLPYLTNAKEGDIPMGFEAGGSMDRLTQMGGGTYNPANYAIHPTSIQDIQNGVTRPSSVPAPAPQAAPQAAPAGAPIPTPSAAMPNAEVAKQIQQAIGR